MTSLGASDGSITRKEMLDGLKYPWYYSNEEISEDYIQLTQKLCQNNNLVIGEKIFFCHKL